MNCPACFRELAEINVNGVTVDVCHGGCGGVWFDAFELQRIEKMSDDPGTQQIVHVPLDPTVFVDRQRKRECPRCAGVKLHRHFFSAKRRVEVDQCPNCGGYWLDAGEVQMIWQEQLEAQAGATKGTQLSITTIRQLYRLKIEQRAP